MLEAYLQPLRIFNTLLQTLTPELMTYVRVSSVLGVAVVEQLHLISSRKASATDWVLPALLVPETQGLVCMLVGVGSVPSKD